MRVLGRKASATNCLTIATLAAFVAIDTPAAAQRSAEAEQLFREGKRLMGEKRYPEACDAFEGSQKLDPTIATLLNLADCRERNAQIATAWGLFLDAERLARSDRGHQPLAETAKKRAAQLEPRLSFLIVNVPDDSRVAGLTINRSGEELDPLTWNRALPVDGGVYTIEAKAPGHEPWSAEVTVRAELDKQSVDVPRFNSLRGAPEVDVPSDAATEPSTAQVQTMWSSRRKIAVGVGGVAVVAAAVGVGFGSGSLSLNDDAAAACPPGCGTSEAMRANQLAERADERARVANVMFGVAAAATTTAVVLWLVGEPASDRQATTAILPSIGPRTGGVTFVARF